MKNNKQWEKKETKDAKLFGGKRNKGSGNRWYLPGDVKTPIYLIDSKATKHKSYSINIDTMDKLYEEALFSYRIPVLSLELQDKEFVVMFKEDWLKLIEEKENPAVG